MKLKTRNILSAILLLLLPLTESRSLKTRSSPLSVQNVFDHTYGHPSYNYDGQLGRNGRGYTRPIHNKIASEAESNEDDGGQRQQIKGTLQANRSPHVVVDDEDNYDYTYGDPEVDYDYEGDTSNENKDDTDEKSDEENSKEVWSPDDDKNSPDSAGDDRKRVTRIVTSIIEWVIRNWEKAKVIRDHWKETKADIEMRWERIKHNMERLKNSLQGKLNRFGRDIQEGLKYCLIKIKSDDKTIEIEASEAIYKLERLLNEGSKLVAAFFRFLGEKANDISSPYVNDIEDIAVGGSPPTRTNMNSASYSLKGQSKEDISSAINLFKDPEVLQKLTSLVEENLINREEADAIIKAAAQQTERSSGSSDHGRAQLR